MYAGKVGALMANNLPDLTEDMCPVEDLDIEWIQELDFRDFETFRYYVECLEIKLSSDQKNCVEWKMTKIVNNEKHTNKLRL